MVDSLAPGQVAASPESSAVPVERIAAQLEHKAGPAQISRLNRFVKPAAWDRQRARACNRRRCSRHFPGSNLHDAAFRRRCKKSAAEKPRQKACGNKGKPARPLFPLPFAEMKRVPPNLDEITALQCAIARGR